MAFRTSEEPSQPPLSIAARSDPTHQMEHFPNLLELFHTFNLEKEQRQNGLKGGSALKKNNNH